jgi:hypothetical protein
MALSAGTRKVLLWVAIVVGGLAAAGWGVELAFKAKYRNEYRRLVADFDQQISVDGIEETARTLDGLRRVIAMAAGRLAGKSWSERDIDFFVKPAKDRAAYLLELICTRSDNGVDVHGYRIADVRDMLRGDLLAAVQQKQKGRALAALGQLIDVAAPTGGLPACAPRPGTAASPGPFLDPRAPYRPGQMSAQVAVRRHAPPPTSPPAAAPRPAPGPTAAPVAAPPPSPEAEERRRIAELRNALALIVRAQNQEYRQRRRYADDPRNLVAAADTSPEFIHRALAQLETGRLRMRLLDGGFEVGAETAPGQWEIVSNKGAQGIRSSF